MISYVNNDLFKKSGTKKELIIAYDGGEIRNNTIYSEQFELKEKICAADNLVFGKCESSELKFKIANTVDTLKDKSINVSMILDGLTNSPFVIGKYKVYSDTVSGNRNYRNIIAYDDMYYILNADITSWYETIGFPVTLKQFRDSLFSFLGVVQEEIALINDDILLEKTIEAVSLKGKDIIPYICELNGVFGHIGRDGLFKYISLSKNVNETVSMDDYSSASYDDFETSPITGVQIRQEDGDIGVSVGTDENKYIVQGNVLVYGKDIDELTDIAQKIFEKIAAVIYVPFNVVKIGNPCMEVGDRVLISVRDKDIESYILERKLYGIQSLRDEYEARGKEKVEDLDISLDEEIKQLKGKSNVLTRTIEETKSEVSNLEESTSSMVQQTSSELNASIKSLEDNMKSSDDATSAELEVIRKQLDVSVTSDELSLEFQKERESGADKVLTSTGYSFDENGMKISKSDSEMATMITDNGMTVSRSGEDVLTANSEGVDAYNLHAKTYLIIGNTSRFEDYYNEDGELRTGCFWIGDIEEIQVTVTGITATYTGGNVKAGTDVNNLSGVSVKATYSDGSEKYVTGYTLSGVINKGNNTITVSYEGVTTTFTVVGYSAITLVSISAKYTGGPVPVGTSVNSLTGITVEAYYSDSSVQKVTSYLLSGKIEEGENTVTVTWNGKTTTFKVTGYVVITVSGISAIYTGSQVLAGTNIEDLRDNLRVTATYSDGTTAIVTDYTLSGTIEEGANTITISYSGKSTTVSVTGYGEITFTGITVNYTGGSMPLGTPTSTIKQYLTVTANYSDGSTQVVTDYAIAGSVSVVGNNEYQVSYNGKGAFFTVVGYDENMGNGIVLGQATTCVVAAWLSGVTGVTSASVKYSEEVEVVDGAIALVDEKSTTLYRLSTTNYVSSQCTRLLGKYVTSTNGSIYYIDPESTYEQKTNVSTYVAENIKYNTAYLVSVA